ncbi:MAG: TIGR04282 family arsenosugar biosynthesis glycosyltransferase [Acidobacteriota bacterium]
MAKYPQAGKVKTRLFPFLNQSQSAQLALCFLKDTLLKIEKLGIQVFLAYSPEEFHDKFAKLVAKSTVLIEQKGISLGERLFNAVSFAETAGFSPIITIGTDSPSFPSQEILKTIEILQSNVNECVFGSTQDGGYYLIGLNKSVPSMFENVEWSSTQTLPDSVRNALLTFGQNPVFISDWYDVDTPEDLKNLNKEFLEKECFANIAPHTAKWLEVNSDLFSSPELERKAE